MKSSTSFDTKGKQLNRNRIFELLGKLNEELKLRETNGELYLVEEILNEEV